MAQKPVTLCLCRGAAWRGAFALAGADIQVLGANQEPELPPFPA
jgi:hypothetical protein